jgi:hypothetical protein
MTVNFGLESSPQEAQVSVCADFNLGALDFILKVFFTAEDIVDVAVDGDEAHFIRTWSSQGHSAGRMAALIESRPGFLADGIEE